MSKTLKIVYKDIDDITPYLNNPRKNDKAIGPVAESIKQFGFKVPVILDKNGIIVAGHTRIKAAKKLGIREIPCIIADDLNDEQIRALRIADNKVAEFAEWDQEALLKELKEIVSIDMDAFGLKHVEALGPEDVIEDNPPDVPKVAKTKKGERYQLGDHVLMCGDSTSAKDVKKLMGGTEADCCVTDPPYGVNYCGDRSPHERTDAIENDNLEGAAFEEFLTKAFGNINDALRGRGCLVHIPCGRQENPLFKRAGGTKDGTA